MQEIADQIARAAGRAALGERVEIEYITAATAGQLILAATTGQGVEAIAAEQLVVAERAQQFIVAIHTRQGIGAAVADQGIGASVAGGIDVADAEQGGGAGGRRVSAPVLDPTNQTFFFFWFKLTLYRLV